MNLTEKYLFARHLKRLLHCCNCLCFTAGLLAIGPLQAQTLRSIAQGGAPVKYATPADSARPGLCREVAQQIERFDARLQIVGFERQAPLRRVELMLERGEIDLFLCMLDTPERRARFDFLATPIYRIRHVVVQRADDARVLGSYAQLAQSGARRPVLVAQGSVLARHLARAGVSYSEVAQSDLAALRMLLLGRAEAVYGQDMTLVPLLQLPELAGRLRVGEVAFFEERHFAAVARQLPGATRQRLESALATLEREGVLRELSDKYLQP